MIGFANSTTKSAGKSRHNIALDLSFNWKRARVSFLLAIFTYFWILPRTTFGSEMTGRLVNGGDELTALFNTYAFQGSMSTIAKIPWVGPILSGIISVSCFIGLFMVCFGIIMSMLYLSARNLFDRVHELKSAGKGQKFFGFMSMGKEVFNGNYGTGLDAIVGFILAFAPDVKEYSYFKEGSNNFNLTENETVTTFILKISLPTIMTIFFFSMGFNGVLWNMYGVVVNGMGTAAKAFVDTSLSQGVERLLNTGASYQFSFAATKTARGKKCQDIASDLYRNARKNTADLSTENQIAIGASIDKWVTKNFYTNKSGWVENFDVDDPSDFENMRTSVVINSNSTDLTTGDDVIDVHARVDDVFGVSTTDTKGDMYVHVLVQRVLKTKSPNYFTVKESKSSSKGNSEGKGTFESPVLDKNK